jgi:hypothetical protein
MEKNIVRKDDDRWCRLEVKLSMTDDGKPDRLSITGSAGSLQKREDLAQQAIDYWRYFFEENSDEFGSIVARFPQDMARYMADYSDPYEAAAMFVVDTDGEFHGLDVEGDEDENGDFLVLESCGQIRDELREWFPEVKPWLRWHLNDMKAACEHQEELGWSHGVTVNLARESATEVQVEVMDKLLADQVAKERREWIDRELQRMQGSGYLWKDIMLRLLNRQPTVADMETLHKINRKSKWTVVSLTYSLEKDSRLNVEDRKLIGKLLNHYLDEAEKEIPDKLFTVQSFEDSLSAPCPECGNRYGSAWLRRELPADVVSWIESLDSLKGE